MNTTTSHRRGVRVGRCRVVDRGPNWLFVRVDRPPRASRAALPDLAAQLLEICEQHFVYRIVLEMECVESVDESTLERLDLVRDRLAEHGGALRLCGLREEVARAIRESLSGGLCNHTTRHSAVVGDPDEAPSWGHGDFHSGGSPLR